MRNFLIFSEDISDNLLSLLISVIFPNIALSIFPSLNRKSCRIWRLVSPLPVGHGRGYVNVHRRALALGAGAHGAPWRVGKPDLTQQD